MRVHTFKIQTHEQREAFEKLFGMQFRTPIVEVPHHTYVRHAEQINAIQMMAALKDRQKQGSGP